MRWGRKLRWLALPCLFAALSFSFYSCFQLSLALRTIFSYIFLYIYNIHITKRKSDISIIFLIWFHFTSFPLSSFFSFPQRIYDAYSEFDNSIKLFFNLKLKASPAYFQFLRHCWCFYCAILFRRLFLSCFYFVCLPISLHFASVDREWWTLLNLYAYGIAIHIWTRMLHASIFQAKEKVLRNVLRCTVYMTFCLVHPCRKHIIESVLWKRFVSITLHCVPKFRRQTILSLFSFLPSKEHFQRKYGCSIETSIRSLVKSLASFCIIKRLLQSIVSFQSSPTELKSEQRWESERRDHRKNIHFLKLLQKSLDKSMNDRVRHNFAWPPDSKNPGSKNACDQHKVEL